MIYCIFSDATFVIIKTMEKNEFRVLMKHFFFMGKSAADTKKWLDECYADSAPAEATIRKWFAKFRTGHMSTEDDERSGRPKEAVTDENIKKIHKMILDDRKLKLHEIAEALKISKERVGHIIHEYLDMRKLCAKWVPRVLTIERIDDSEACLQLITHNKPDFFRRYVTIYVKLGSITTLRSPIVNQPSRLHAMNRLQSVERLNSRLARSWPQFFGMLME